MIMKIKYIGSSETGLTVNNEYFVLALEPTPNPVAIILNDAGVPYKTFAINNTAEWQVVSVEYSGLVTVYP